MRHRYSTGFTIIETSLVLAVTGLVIAMVLIGIGNSLKHERYKDAVNQTISFFRSQYVNTANIINSRNNSGGCGSSGINTTPTEVGTSSCTIVGNVVRSSDGENIEVYQVISTHDVSTDASLATVSHQQILSSSNLIQGVKIDSYRIDWGSTLLNPGTNNPSQFSLMVVRVPVAGDIDTFTSSNSTDSVANLANVSQSDFKLCIDQSGFFNIGVRPMGVLITKGASESSSVQPIASGACV